MINSLKLNSSQKIKIFIVTLDSQTYNYLENLNLPFINLIMLEDLENNKLIKVKKERTLQEYYWTCTPWIVKYVLEKFNLSHCTYIDADLYFYNDPKLILDELKTNDSILITEHNYYKKYDQSKSSGIYCVQFMYFKNDLNGKKSLDWWADQCLNWCYNRHEDGKFGDQKYLEKFEAYFDGVHVLKNNSLALAPWNIRNHLNFIKRNKPVFFHFHSVKYLNSSSFFLGYYRLNNFVIKSFYLNYLKELLELKLFNLPEIDLSKKDRIKIVLKNLFNYNHTIKI